MQKKKNRTEELNNTNQNVFILTQANSSQPVVLLGAGHKSKQS